MDCIIPILTEGYAKRLRGEVEGKCLDSTYAPFLYDVASKDYLDKGCMNYKVRCIVGHPTALDLPPLSIDPVFSAYFHTHQLEQLSCMILKSKPKRTESR